MKKFYLTILVAIIFNICTIKAGILTDSVKTDIKNQIKPIVRVFSNFHSSLDANPNSSAFDIQRAYVGFKYDFDNCWSSKIYFDIGNPKNKSDYEYSAFLKEASLTYKKGNLLIDFGLISLLQFKEQDKIWAHRYVMKTFIDLYKLGTSYDFGTNVSYKINNYINIDATIRNGEGFKKSQADNTYSGSFGLTIKPFKGFILREFIDYSEKSEYQETISTFLGYSIPNKFLIGFEYNYQQNSKYVIDADISGISGYSTYYITKKIGIFGRYDLVTSSKLPNATSTWNYANDGSAIIGGIEYFPIDKIKMSLNYQSWLPDNPIIDKAQFIYVNFDYEF